MLNIGDASLVGGGGSIRTEVWDATKEVLEQWTGVELSPSSLYGVRVYQEGAVLAPHVDRNPLVISAIVNVAQDVDEEWPLEVYGHDGNAYNITMEPGDIILYESHSILHGRPFPLKGRHYANVFIHFEPLSHSTMQKSIVDEQSLEYLYEQAYEKQKQQCDKDDEECNSRIDLNINERAPPYIVPGSLEEKRWIQTHPRAKLSGKSATPNLTAHTAASSGDLEALMEIAAKDPEAIKKIDNNGWSPLHEAVRGGHIEVVSYLLSKGADVNMRTVSLGR